MCLGGSSKPEDPPAPPPIPRAPTRADPEVRRAREDERRNLALLSGDRSTIRTSAQGLLSPANTRKTNILGGGGSF
jgi:hypothetical protein